MSSALTVGIAIAGVLLLNGLLRFTRWAVRLAPVSRWAWLHSQARALGTPRRKWLGHPRRRPRKWLTRCLAKAIVWHAGRPLRIQAFEGPDDLDSAGVSSTLSAAMTRIASLRRSGVDTVTAPIGAGTAIEAVADGVKAAPAGGELAAALLRLGWWALARSELQLSGYVLAPSVGGPGLALTLATASGRVIERLTLRASEFEPAVGAHEVLGRGDEADRMLRVATAGAVWTHFKILEEVWHLSEADLELSLRTSAWRSYALTRVGTEGREHYGLEVTRAFYAKAVDADPSNLVAQFNLAATELKDKLLAHVRAAGTDRLEHVHDRLHAEDKSVQAEHGLGRELEQKQLLLNRDPLHYQVAYKRLAAKLNVDTAVEAKHEYDSRGRQAVAVLPSGHWSLLPTVDGSGEVWQPIEGLSLTPEDLAEFTTHLRDLELTLAVLQQAALRQWVAASSKPWTQLRCLLGELEGPMLVLWAMVALRVGRPASQPWSPEALQELSASEARNGLPSPDTGPDTRARLVDRLERGLLSPGAAVAFAGGSKVLTSSRTRFNLACWYADIGCLDDSLSELEMSLECGGELATRRLGDQQLRRVREVHGEEWRKLQARYLSVPADVANNRVRRPPVAPRYPDHFPLP